MIEGKAILISKNHKPYGIRDDSGFILFFRNITHYDGQDDRYYEEIIGLYNIAEFIRDALNNEESEINENIKPPEYQVVSYK